MTGSLSGLFKSLLTNPQVKKILGVVIVVVMGILVGRAESYKRKTQDLEERAKELVQIDSISRARLATLEADRDSLSDLLSAANSMGGTLAAGVQIIVKSDTITTPPDTVPTVVAEDSTRTARLEADTLGYKIVIDAEAPPFPSPLLIGYSFSTPTFNPQVGFVEKDGDFYAVVSWNGQTFTPQNAFVRGRARPWRLYAGTILGSRGGDHLYAGGYASFQYQYSPRVNTMANVGWAGESFVEVKVEVPIL